MLIYNAVRSVDFQRYTTTHRLVYCGVLTREFKLYSSSNSILIHNNSHNSHNNNNNNNNNNSKKKRSNIRSALEQQQQPQQPYSIPTQQEFIQQMTKNMCYYVYLKLQSKQCNEISLIKDWLPFDICKKTQILSIDESLMVYNIIHNPRKDKVKQLCGYYIDRSTGMLHVLAVLRTADAPRAWIPIRRVSANIVNRIFDM